MNRRALKPWHGIVFFIIIMASFFFICVPMQMYWGLYGVATTELLILVIALIFARIMRFPFKVIFPVKMPGILPILGTAIMWVSTYLISMVVMLIQYRLFPQQMTEVSGGLNDVIYSLPFLISIFIVSIMPAVCEEAVHRGIILHTLYTLKHEWVIVLIMGIYFGLFHTSAVRFLPTAILGAAMSYIMLETENMVYSSFFHCINNLLPMLLQQFLLSGMDTQQITSQAASATVPVASIGIYMVFAAAAPFGLYLGNYLLHYKKGIIRRFIPREKIKKILPGILIPTVCLFGLGILIMICGILFDPAFQEIMNEATNMALR
ncbi:MAG: CPBP family intramembrane metalloprotease [Clostridia bacterium]|nr:CPBP family intramembrane metalloprotease [Clostridia bacterium]NCC43124.1 CPBP family intramembrane metalloprotease [Clostridia bacterium]